MWKTFGGHCLYQSPNDTIVHQNVLYRWLTLGSTAIQTLINRRDPQKPELGYIDQLGFAVRAQPGECCLLGLGGAGIAHALAPILGSTPLVAVESNAEIIEISATYFMSDRIKNMSIVHQDASIYVQQCTTQYQHLMVDLYEAHSFPKQCNTHNFFENCQRLLLPQGVLAVNLTNLDEQWPIFQLIRENFDQRTIALPVKRSSNMIILAYKNPSLAPLLDMVKDSHCLKKLSWDTRWGCIAQLW